MENIVIYVHGKGGSVESIGFIRRNRCGFWMLGF